MRAVQAVTSRGYAGHSSPLPILIVIDGEPRIPYRAAGRLVRRKARGGSDEGPRVRHGGGPGQGRRHQRIPGHDVLLLREELQDEVRRQPEAVREVASQRALGPAPAGPERPMPTTPTPPETAAEAEVIDPVCGMSILPSDAVGHVEH